MASPNRLPLCPSNLARNQVIVHCISHHFLRFEKESLIVLPKR